jgi:DNA-binding HxlR family transcriptional regulator
MTTKGLGDTQIRSEKAAKQKIITLLSDGQPHRFNEIQEKTKLSTATLSKHLKELKGIIERKVDSENQKYPPPVAYRIRNPELASSIEREKEQAQKIASCISEIRHINYSPITDFLETAQFNFNIHFLLNLRLFFWPKSEVNPRTDEEITFRENAYAQYLESLIMPNFANWLSVLKEKLEDLEKQGVNVSALLSVANKQIMKDASRKQTKKESYFERLEKLPEKNKVSV